MKKRTWPQLIKMVHDIEKRRESVNYASDAELKKLHRLTREPERDFPITPTELYYLKQILYEGMSMRSASGIIKHDRRWILTHLDAVKQLDFHIEDEE
ncbi:hypothetical protein MUDAN_BIHEEGNE_02253 [Lactiplantibacillus mudanjiangensis]|uniref:hypothetical protein n=1 Tax=Lactiplantibacillus mudanjiangensis TaxID=1296538 RepID=UPI0010150E67|nr:hypothetical protein MUDAN_BIHEEGNE_02253 [Lactiplantibacillus mudanjiangensis]